MLKSISIEILVNLWPHHDFFLYFMTIDQFYLFLDQVHVREWILMERKSKWLCFHNVIFFSAVLKKKITRIILYHKFWRYHNLGVIDASSLYSPKTIPFLSKGVTKKYKRQTTKKMGKTVINRVLSGAPPGALSIC